MIDSLTRRVLESYILDRYRDGTCSKETMGTLKDLYKVLTGVPFSEVEALNRRWGLRE